ncbi:hypothetical protein HNQ60_002184 [Povalibacter uvarum]|uniref:Uncharacterized protein n=1 Tax=Povalibacter uvarum TaxID=732238 RepID=A0A841HKE6_9GAMM|nr:hypothetical protein [Povalibacter uvarum]
MSGEPDREPYYGRVVRWTDSLVAARTFSLYLLWLIAHS